ncbi:MAG: hypothetical protein AAGA23_09555 [Pseudomonadota bacterium]
MASASEDPDKSRCVQRTAQEKQQLRQDLEQLTDAWAPFDSRYFEALQDEKLPALIQSLGTPDAAFVAMGLRHQLTFRQCQPSCALEAFRGPAGAFDKYVEAYPDHLPIRLAALGACPTAQKDRAVDCFEPHAAALLRYAPEDALGPLLLASAQLLRGDRWAAMRFMRQAAGAETVDLGAVQILRMQSEILQQVLPPPLPEEPASLRPLLARSTQGWMGYGSAGIVQLEELKTACLTPDSEAFADACLLAADAMTLPLARMPLAEYAHEIRLGVAEYRGEPKRLAQRIEEMAQFKQLPYRANVEVLTEDDALRAMSDLAQFGEYHSYLRLAAQAAACEAR